MNKIKKLLSPTTALNSKRYLYASAFQQLIILSFLMRHKMPTFQLQITHHAFKLLNFFFRPNSLPLLKNWRPFSWFMFWNTTQAKFMALLTGLKCGKNTWAPQLWFPASCTGNRYPSSSRRNLTLSVFFCHLLIQPREGRSPIIWSFCWKI